MSVDVREGVRIKNEKEKKVRKHGCLTLSWRFVVAGVEGSSKGRGRIGDFPVKMAAAPTIDQDAHRQHEDHTQQQSPH